MQIIRCKECIYRDENGYCHEQHEYNDKWVSDNFFCYYGNNEDNCNDE